MNLSARRRERRRREPPTGELQLAAMVDMMINLLLFLLNLYGSSTGAVRTQPGLVFAPSTEVTPVRFAPTVVVSTEQVVVGDTPIGTWSAQGRAPDAGEREALTAAVANLPRDPDPRHPQELLLQVDRRVPWVAIGPVLDAATAAGFADVRFVVSSTSSAAGG